MHDYNMPAGCARDFLQFVVAATTDDSRVGVPVKCSGNSGAPDSCSCDGPGNPPGFTLICGAPAPCPGPPSYTGGNGCGCGSSCGCGCDGGSGGGRGSTGGGRGGGCGGSGNLGGATLCGLGAGSSDSGPPGGPASPSSTSNQRDPLAYAYGMSQNVRGSVLAGQGGAIRSGNWSSPAVNLDTGALFFQMQPPPGGTYAGQMRISHNGATPAALFNPNDANLGNQNTGSFDQITASEPACLFFIDCCGFGQHFDYPPTTQGLFDTAYFSSSPSVGDITIKQPDGFSMFAKGGEGAPISRMQTRPRGQSINLDVDSRRQQSVPRYKRHRPIQSQAHLHVQRKRVAPSAHRWRWPGHDDHRCVQSDDDFKLV